jgi:hypothetical protein
LSTDHFAPLVCPTAQLQLSTKQIFEFSFVVAVLNVSVVSSAPPNRMSKHPLPSNINTEPDSNKRQKVHDFSASASSAAAVVTHSPLKESKQVSRSFF